MPGLMENLIGILGEQAESYENLAGLSLEKKDAIVANNIEDLQKITSLENTLVGKHHRLERQRLSVLKDIALVLSRKEEDLTFTALLALLEGKPDYPRMEEIVGRIRKAVPELKSINDQNKQLIDNSLAYIDFTMNAIRGSLGGEPSVYPLDGTKNSGYDDGKSFFDAKK